MERRAYTITIVFPFDKSLPLAKPLHADAVYDRWRLILLECLVQLQIKDRQDGEKMGEEYPAERRGKGYVRMKEWKGLETNQFSLAVIPIRG